jgi:hypothetical protein
MVNSEELIVPLNIWSYSRGVALTDVVINGFDCTGHTQKNGAVSILFTFETAPFFCVCPVYIKVLNAKLKAQLDSEKAVLASIHCLVQS